MKKLLLFVASLTLAFGAEAQVAVQPSVVGFSLLSAMSPNGKYAAGNNLYSTGVDVMNVETGEVEYFFDEDLMEEYTIGMGANPISNDGVVVISSTYQGTAAYIENSEIKLLPVPAGVTISFANAITPDGSRIAGNIGIDMTLDAKEVMERPVIWNRLEDGTYSDPIELPYPKTDVTGRMPQYILVNGISEDGKTLAAQMTDASGMLSQAPMLFKEGEDGKWTYEYIGEEFLNPTGMELPEACEYPEPEDYLTGDALQAYLDAKAYGESLLLPDPTEYMTDEGLAQYLADIAEQPWIYDYSPYMTEEKLAEYEADVNEYWYYQNLSAEEYLDGDDLAAYEDAFSKYLEFVNAWDEFYETQDVKFVMNSIIMSQNAKYVAVAGEVLEPGMVYNPWWDEWEEGFVQLTKTYVFDMETGAYAVKDCEDVENVNPTYIANDGRLLAAEPINQWTSTGGNAFYAAGFSCPLRPLVDVVRENNPELYAFMEENMLHTIVSNEWNEETEEEVEVVKEVWFTGIPCSNADMSSVTTWALNLWDAEGECPMYSYVLPMGDSTLTGIEEVGEDSKKGEEIRHNLNGQRVGKDYKGIVISGKKIKVIK